MAMDVLDQLLKRRMALQLPRLAGASALGLEPLPGLDEQEDEPPLSAEEEEGLARKLARRGIGGLSWVGETLGKPGAAVTGTLSGITDLLQGRTPRWGGGLLNLLPLTDTFKFTDPDQRVYSRDLLEKWGALKPNKPGLDVGDVLGFGLDLALDPLTYATFGASALGKAGQVAKAAGVLDDAMRAAARGVSVNRPVVQRMLKGAQAPAGWLGKAKLGKRQFRMNATLDDVLEHYRTLGPAAEAEAVKKLQTAAQAAGTTLDELREARLGGLMGFGLPPLPGLGGRGPLFTTNLGAAGEKYAKGADFVGQAMKASGLGRWTRRAFQASVRGRATELGQDSAQHAAPLYEATLARHQPRLLQAADVLDADDVLRKRGREQRMIAEGVPNAPPPVSPNEQQAVELVRDLSPRVLQEQRDAGWAIDALEDPFAKYHSHRGLGSDATKSVDLSPSGGIETGPAIRREMMLRGHKGGTTGIDDTFRDPKFEQIAQDPNFPTEIEKIKEAEDYLRNSAHTPNIQDWMPKVDDDGWMLYDRAVLQNGQVVMTPRGNVKVRKGDPVRLRMGRAKSLLQQQVAGTNNPVPSIFEPHQISRTVSRRGQQVAEVLVPRHGSRLRQYAEAIIRSQEYRQTGMFTNNFVTDASNMVNWHAGRLERAEFTADLLGRSLPNAPDGVTVMSGGIRKGKALGEAENLQVEKVLESQGFDFPTIGKRIIERRAANGLIAKPVTPDEWAKALRDLRQEYISPDYYRELVPQKAVTPEGGVLEKAGNVARSNLALFKAGVLTWPARYARDIMSGIERLTERGMAGPGDLWNARKLFQGQSVRGGLEQIPAVQDILRDVLKVPNPARATPEETSRAMRLLYSTYHSPVHRIESELTGVPRLEGGLEQVTQGLVGRQERGLLGGIGNLLATGVGARREPGLSWLQSLKPWRVRGWHEGWTGKPLQNPEFALAAAGDIAGQATDNIPRMAGFINLLKKGVDPQEAMRQVNLSLVSYNPRDYTALERKLKQLLPFYSFCMPVDHQILSQDGWKTYDQLAVGEPVLTLNHETGTLEWQPVQAINVFPHDGPLLAWQISRKHKKVRFEFTSNHRWPILTETGTFAYCLASGESRRGRRHVKRRWRLGGDLRQHDRIPCTGDFQTKEASILNVRLAKLLGWIVTDGFFRRRPRGERTYAEARIYQSPHKHLQELIELTGSVPCKPHPISGVVALNVKIDDLREIMKVFQTKADLCRIVCRLSREAAEAMWDAMFKAEGSTSAAGNMHFAQSPEINPEVLDAFQILCLMTGRTAHLSSVGCFVKRSKCWYVHDRITSFDYEGLVWCPTTANGTWIARHDGAVTITGNSSRQIPYVMQELTNRPGGRLGMLIKGSSRAREPDAMAPDYVSSTMSVPIGASPEGGRRYLTSFGLMHEDPMAWAKLMQGDMRGFLTELASRARPELKGATEYATNRIFFQSGPTGPRDASDADPLLGRLWANLRDIKTGQKTKKVLPLFGSLGLEMAAANSPPSRLLTTARMVTDPDKYKSVWPLALQLLTGARVTRVSPGAEEAILRETAGQLMKRMGGAEFVRSYIKPEVLAQMDPESRALGEQLNAAQRIWSRRQRERKKAEEKGQRAKV